MMNHLEIKATKGVRGFLSPDISLKPSSGECELSGRSLMSNPRIFYAPVFEWIEAYEESKVSEILMLRWHIRIAYFSSSSKKIFIMLFKRLYELPQQVELYWYCLREDTDLVEELEEMSKESGLEIHLVFEEI